MIFAVWGLVAIGPGFCAARELRLSHQMPESDARHRAARVLAAELKKRAPDLAITFHPNSALIGDPPQQCEAIIEGKIEMAVYPMGYASAKFPELSVVTMPGIPSSAEAASLLKGSQFETKLQELCEEKGFLIVTCQCQRAGSFEVRSATAHCADAAIEKVVDWLRA
ncbi:MAG TPA: hypothetical protein VLL28_06740 [Hyphomicrobiaceae bacterium]|nr:hypothetical protein [Hyphomicrobiaceae bacterium]